MCVTVFIFLRYFSQKGNQQFELTYMMLQCDQERKVLTNLSYLVILSLNYFIANMNHTLQVPPLLGT